MASAKIAARPRSEEPAKEPDNRRAFQSALVAWFATAGRDLPWRRTRDPYAILVSECMLQQTQVATVIAYYHRWLAQFPDVQALARAAPEDVLRAWEGLGYYARARNLQAAARQIVAEHAGVFPRELAQIAALPGVGRYTAGAVASFAFDTPAPIVDANIARVLARVIRLETPIDTAAGQRVLWTAAAFYLPGENARLYNSALMELGATLCSPRQPRCLLCPVRQDCAAAPHDPERLPRKRARPATVLLDENCGWCVRAGALLLQQETGARWRGLWKLPPLAAPPPLTQSPLCQLIYPFTNHRITLRVYPAPDPAALALHQQWHPLENLHRIALPAPHRRAVTLLANSACALYQPP